MTTKIKIGVLFGGRSAEHEVSLVSAASVIHALDKNKYDILPIGITKDGRWLSEVNAIQLLRDHAPLETLPEHVLLPDPRKQSLINVSTAFPQAAQHIDVIFPVIHGTFGEDGTIQGLFELADIPYVGAGVLGSAVGMDKIVAKQLLERANIPVTKSIWFFFSEYQQNSKRYVADIEKKLRYPCFVKPPNQGSSVGISKAHNRKELLAAIELAGQYDRKILVEKAVTKPREIEVSVLGNNEPVVSLPGEIIPSNEFYDYDAKYVDGKSTAVIPAKLPKNIVKKIQQYAAEAFKVLDCAGMARIDFLVQKDGKIFLNEINTIPGFTSISMYPKLWEASGIKYPELLDRLIQLAIDRHDQKKQLKTFYTPKTDWYKKP
ncbi:MAG: D-alanine--D-alanine ligase [Ignavibacteriales bacterium]|nr:D-alanine--D-alanine ligase [Ignavibacteriales bacterium]